ncbi:rho GTPase-activating protein 20 [Erinaceus europaeus]|uniref:Rho GTPase-activating protein 20 n=1 Tax=Erinaceus europaeus TaxID=9365 RepID=A0A1S3WT14_ERIEU|nr:rho GTPase-activating protein 20 [Erinaceus europaeus]
MAGPPARSSLPDAVIRAPPPAPGKKMKSVSERRKSAPSLFLERAIMQKRPSTNEISTGVETGALLSIFDHSDRDLLIDGRVELRRGLQKQERHIFLFNDLFIVTKVKCNNNFKLKNKIKLTDMWTANCIDEVGEGHTSAIKSFVLGWPVVNFVVTFSSSEEKEKWMCLLQRYITLEKEKEFPKTVPLKVYAKEMSSCADSKTIMAANTDTVNEVVKMLLPEFGMTGTVSDFQLWLNSGKEGAPYPLIGHEYPYVIKMHHLRDTALLAEGPKDAMMPDNFQEPFVMEQLPQEMQCHFILKSRHLSLTQKLSDSGSKTFKRRKSIMSWAFWRGSQAHLDNMPFMPMSPESPTSPVPGQLFGASLGDICTGEDLPRPIMDLIIYLYKKGPLTVGIFRLSASARAIREFKEKLQLNFSSGVEVNLDMESPILVAAVLKEFLRNIPGSLLSSEFYHCWICIVDEENREDRISTIKRLLDQLPKVNIVLLKHIFALLYSIDQNSSVNQMNTFNLAVCFTPTLLWPPTNTDRELESSFTKKVTLLVQFVIENCCELFGEGITSLLREDSLQCNTTENTTDTLELLPNNSSFNSLEADIEAPSGDFPDGLLDTCGNTLDSKLMDTTDVSNLEDTKNTSSLKDDELVDIASFFKLEDATSIEDEEEHMDTTSIFNLEEAVSFTSLKDEELLGTLNIHNPEDDEFVDSMSVTSLEDELVDTSSSNTLDKDLGDGQWSNSLEREQVDTGRGNTLNRQHMDTASSDSGRSHCRRSLDSMLTPSDLESENSKDNPLEQTVIFPHDLLEASTSSTIAPYLKSARRSSEPNICSKFTIFTKFYPKKTRKSSCDAVLLQKDMESFQGESKIVSDVSLLTETNTYSKKGLREPVSKYRPKTFSVNCCGDSDTSSQNGSTNRLPNTNTSLLNTSGSPTSQRCRSESNMGKNHHTLNCLRGIFTKQKTSYPLDLLDGQDKSLETPKSGTVVPPPSNYKINTTDSTVSSPGTSSPGDSKSQESDIFGNYDTHGFTALETTLQNNSEELSSHLDSAMPGPSSAQASTKKVGWHSQVHSVTWLRNSLANLKNWSLRRTRTSKAEEKQPGSPRESPPPASSGKVMPFKEAGVENIQKDQVESPQPCRDLMECNTVEDEMYMQSADLCIKSEEYIKLDEGGGLSEHCAAGPLSHTNDLDLSNPDSGSSENCDVRGGHTNEEC